MHLKYSNHASQYVQELLDARQKQQSATQVVEEIRKQADEVPNLTSCLFSLLPVPCSGCSHLKKHLVMLNVYRHSH
jgi:superoxide dismutase